MKHQVYKKNDGYWSCRVCKWHFDTRPNKANCPGVLRIACADDDYKTEKQWRNLGYEIVLLDGHHYPVTDAVSIVHSTNWHRFYHRSHVKKLLQ
jgi:hypothetical protein